MIIKDMTENLLNKYIKFLTIAFDILFITKTKTIASMIETIILFILKKFVNLVQLKTKIYHDFD